MALLNTILWVEYNIFSTFFQIRSMSLQGTTAKELDVPNPSKEMKIHLIPPTPIVIEKEKLEVIRQEG